MLIRSIGLLRITKVTPQSIPFRETNLIENQQRWYYNQREMVSRLAITDLNLTRNSNKNKSWSRC